VASAWGDPAEAGHRWKIHHFSEVTHHWFSMLVAQGFPAIHSR
jgi:hypothetical protein